MKIYINGSSCISSQDSFSGNYSEPKEYIATTLACIEPDYKAYIDAKLMRRMGRLIKMGIATATQAIQTAEIQSVDGIISGTGLGCLDDTGTFLNRMSDPSNRMMNPTAFINSTHNTVGSLIAIHLGSKGYNSTFSHLDVSFENALQDAVLALKTNEAENLLVGAFDELTPDIITIYNRLNYLRKDAVSNLKLFESKTHGTIAGEACAYFALSTEKRKNSIAELSGLKILYKPSKTIFDNTINEIKSHHDQLVIISGQNGDLTYDSGYKDFENSFNNIANYKYKNLCGSFPTASAFAFWLSLEVLSGKISLVNALTTTEHSSVLIYNRNQDYHSFISLKKC